MLRILLTQLSAVEKTYHILYKYGKFIELPSTSGYKLDNFFLLCYNYDTINYVEEAGINSSRNESKH